MKGITIKDVSNALVLTLALCVVTEAGACKLDCVCNALTPDINCTAQYILNLVNAESGATKSLHASEAKWIYSMALMDPCTLRLTEELQSTNTAGPGNSTVPVREMTHYLIPAADLDIGPLGTRLKLERPGVMKVIISTRRGTIRRWYGDSTVMPQSADVGYEATVMFSKPNVDIFDATVRLENAVKHLAVLCRAEARPDTDPFRPR